MDEEQVLPEGWQDEFLDKADLDHSFQRLEGYGHFYAMAMRGLIRSLQLRLPEGRRYFDKAGRLAERAPETVANLIRRSQLHIFRFNALLLEGPVREDPSVLERQLPDVPADLERQYPGLKVVMHLRRATEAVFRLHLGQYGLSASIYERLIQDDSDAPRDAQFTYFLGLAAAKRNLGLEEEASRNLENGALAVQTGGRTLNRARAAGTLFGYHSYLGNHGESAGWGGFLDRMDCPETTKDVFLKRGKLIIERSLQQSRLVLL